MAHNDALMELDALREQFGYINEKLDKQSLISEKMISETIRTKINRTEQWYRQRFLIYALCPVGIVSFVNMGFHWGYIALCDAYGNEQCYSTLLMMKILLKKKTASSQ